MKIKKINEKPGRICMLAIGDVFKIKDDDNLYLKIGSYSSPIKAFNLTTNELVIGEELEFSDIKKIKNEFYYYPNNDYHFSSFENANIGDVFIINRKNSAYIKIKEPSDNILPDFNVFNLITKRLEFVDPDEEITIFEAVLEYED